MRAPVVAMSISINKQPIVLMSVYMPHSGYADHHVEKVHKTILKTIEKERSAKIGSRAREREWFGEHLLHPTLCIKFFGA